MKVLFSCGGTGGHINPAIAIANTFKIDSKDTEILFVGTKNGMEQKLVSKAGYDIEFVKARGFKRKLSLANVDAAIKAVTSVFAAKKIIKRFKPDVVIGTGGYASWAAVKAAAKLKVPTLIHEQNAFPGMTTRQLAKYADRICLSFEGTEKYFTPEQREKAVVTGNPLKPEIETADRAKARQSLGLSEGELYIVSFGGSLGAEKVNEFCFELMDTYVRNTGIRYYHATGSGGFEKYSAIAKEKGLDKLPNVKIEEYIYDMEKHLAAADLLICRAGAITLAELCVMGRASVLIPSPNVTDDHQYKNAKTLADREAAVVFRESELDGKKLTAEVKSLVNDRERLKRLGENAKAFGRPKAAKRICELALGLIKK